MGKLYRKFPTKLRQTVFSPSIAFYAAITWATKLFLGLVAGFISSALAGEGETVVTGTGRSWMIPVVTTVGSLISGPVVDKKNPRKFLGLVTHSNVIQAYESEARKIVGAVQSI